MLSDCCPVCLSCLSVTLVYCGETVGWIKMKLGIEEGLGQATCVRWRPSPSLQKGGTAALPSPHFSAHVYIVVKWLDGLILPLGTEVGGPRLGPGHMC